MRGTQYSIAESETLATSAKANFRLFPSDASIVLVGCRGAGKRTLGFIAAKYLGRRLLTEDPLFENATGCNRGTFFQKYGRDTLNRQLAAVLAQTLEAHRFNCVIECSTTPLTQETQAVLSTYAQTNPVIYIHRDKEDLYKLLQLPVADAERLLVTDHKHRECCNFEYFNLLDTSPDGQVDGETPPLRSATIHSARLIYAKQEFINFLDQISGRTLTRSWVQNPFSVKAIPPEHRLFTFVLNLRLSTLIDMERDLAQLEAPAEVVELIIDTWPDNVLDLIATQVALIRRKLDIPIIYSVEEFPREERRRPLIERDTSDLELMMHGLRLGVDYLNLDLDRTEELVSKILSMRGRTKIIGNYVIRGIHTPQWDDDTYMQRYVRAQRLGCHIARIARFCMGQTDEERRRSFLDKIARLPEPKPHIIAYDFSVFGMVTVLQSPGMIPIGHALLKSSREQMVGVSTARGAIRTLFRKGLLKPLNFYVLGANVYYSASPHMHRAAFEHYMMPHTFEAKRCTTIEEVDRLRRDPNFGGASLTAPFKVAIMDHLDYVSFHATAIGAVNTLLPLRGGGSSIFEHANARNRAGVTDKFYGDNTDWNAIITCLRRAISPRNSVHPSRTTGLIIGAGGMARAAVYALIKLGCRKIFIHNRTRSKAYEVAAHFNAYAKEQELTRQGETGQICYVIENANNPWPAGYEQPTIVLSCIPSLGIDDEPAVDFRMPAQWLQSPTGGVVIELAYEPLITPLIIQIRKIRDEGNTLWVLIDGLEVVCEMAMEAFELYTGRNAPRRLMRTVCDEAWTSQCAPFQPARLA
ncbi:type I 3-dehydroquinase-domain-containing protein [Xylaria intraflava]|nr:type I 3-dehydroquinase-domain-containing protein [Xylaria intraflava]